MPEENEKTTGRKYAKKDDDVLPALYEHCVRTYKAMLAEASANGEVIVYEGFLTNLITQKVMLSVPYYGKIRTLLIDMGCIRQLKRGGGTSPSQWEMITEPTEEAFLKVYQPDSPSESRLGKVSDRVTRLEQQQAKILGELQSIKQFLADQHGTEDADDD